jgi:hypothetical protein
MANDQEIRALRLRAKAILQSRLCQNIRFKLANVHIQSTMWGYIGAAVGENLVHLQVGTGHHYDPGSNTITFDDDVPEAKIIVHEATHAIIDATHVGQTITTGVHETSAYLAETIFTILTGKEAHLDVPHLTPSVAQLARRVIAFNSKSLESYECTTAETGNIIAILEHSNLRMNTSHTERMDGIGD